MTSIDDGFPGLGASNSRRKKKNNNNKKKKTQISSLGKELFLMGLNYDGGITVTINNKSTTIMKNTPPHSLNKEYRRMFPKATPFICACEKGHLDDVQNLIWIEKIKLKELPANVRNFKFKTCRRCQSFAFALQPRLLYLRDRLVETFRTVPLSPLKVQGFPVYS